MKMNGIKFSTIQHRQINNWLNSLFLPADKRSGIEKGLTVAEMAEKLLKLKWFQKMVIQCDGKRYKISEISESPLFWAWFKRFICKKLHSTVMSPRSPYHISAIVEDHTYYYYPMTTEEARRTREESEGRLEAQKIGHHIRHEIEVPKHMELLGEGKSPPLLKKQDEDKHLATKNVLPTKPENKEDLKQCSECKQWKAKTEFSRHLKFLGRDKNELNPRCNKCMSKFFSPSHQENKEEGKKQCFRCKQWKDKKEFTRDSRAKDGLRSYCRKCVSEYTKQQHNADNSGTKYCHFCEQWKDQSDFYKDKSQKGGLRNTCKDCDKEQYGLI